VAFGGARAGFNGLGLEVANGQDLSNDVFANRRSSKAILPVSTATVDGVERLYVTEQRANGRNALGALEKVGLTWRPLGDDLIPIDVGGNVTGAASPLVYQDGATWNLFYSALDADGAGRIRRATSPDGLTWTPVGGDVLDSGEDWDSVAQYPHSIEKLDDGSIRLWYSGDDGSIWRIGSMTAPSVDGRFKADPGEFDPWVFAPGTPGSFDDGGVKDPFVFTDAQGTHLYYAGFDGSFWHLGHALRDADGVFERRADAIGETSAPSMTGLAHTFSAGGVESPVGLPQADGSTLVYYAGFDGFQYRLGSAISDPGRQEIVFPTQRYPTSGDTIEFDSTRGDRKVSAIDLAQVTADFTTDGTGMTAMIPDYERGFLYVLSKVSSYVYVIDIRDDSTLGFDDSNYLDLEGIIRVTSLVAGVGFRGGAISESRDRLYLTSNATPGPGGSPGGIFVLDLTRLEDNDSKEVLEDVPEGTLPIRSLLPNAGPATLSLIGGDGVALSQDENLLLVTEFRSNLLDVYDLGLGAFGDLTAEIPWLGEDPHVVRISPDGKYAVVANYVGEIVDDASSSTLAVIDIDPASPTYLEPVTWLANQ
jgi:hypothetical protein